MDGEVPPTRFHRASRPGFLCEYGYAEMMCQSDLLLGFRLLSVSFDIACDRFLRSLLTEEVFSGMAEESAAGLAPGSALALDCVQEFLWEADSDLDSFAHTVSLLWNTYILP
jgi:hypothetical protein